MDLVQAIHIIHEKHLYPTISDGIYQQTENGPVQ